MFYHLPRMAYWRQQASVAFIATPIPRQNFLCPFAEWCMLHLSLMQGKINLANMVQWGSYVGCILTVAAIVQLTGGDGRESLSTRLFCATLPMAVLQSTSTQNDLTESFGMALLLYGCIRISVDPGWTSVCFVGASLGLAALIKNVAYLFGFPLIVWCAFSLARHGFRSMFLRMTVIVILSVGLNAGYLCRNLATSGSPLGPKLVTHSGHDFYTNDIDTPGVLFSNVLRNVGLHLLFPRGNSFITRTIIRIHHAFHLDPDDPRTMWQGSHYEVYTPGNEDACGMPWHLIFIGLGMVVLLFFARSLSPPLCWLSLCIVTGALLFCFVLKWQPWHTRLHLALFVMASPIVAAVLRTNHPAPSAVAFPGIDDCGVRLLRCPQPLSAFDWRT